MMTVFMVMMVAQNYHILNADQEKELADAEQALIQQQSQADEAAGPSQAEDAGGHHNPVLLPQTDEAADPTPYRTPESGSALYRDEDYEDNNPYSQGQGGHVRMSRRPPTYVGMSR